MSTTGNSAGSRLTLEPAATGVRAIGVIVPDLANPFFAELASAVDAAARASGAEVVLCTTRFQRARERDHIDALNLASLDGVVLSSGHGQTLGVHEALASARELVVVDERLAALDAPFVGADNRAGARAAARHLVDAGHRRIGVIAGPVGLWTSNERVAGYLEELSAAGVNPENVPVAAGDFRVEGGEQATHELLTAHPDLTAVLVANDLMALGTLRHCKQAGLDVPRDLSVVGFDDIDQVRVATPALTTVRQSARDLGLLAASALLMRLAGHHDAVPQTQIIDTRLVQRGSVEVKGDG